MKSSVFALVSIGLLLFPLVGTAEEEMSVNLQFRTEPTLALYDVEPAVDREGRYNLRVAANVGWRVLVKGTDPQDSSRRSCVVYNIGDEKEFYALTGDERGAEYGFPTEPMEIVFHFKKVSGDLCNGSPVFGSIEISLAVDKDDRIRETILVKLSDF